MLSVKKNNYFFCFTGFSFKFIVELGEGKIHFTDPKASKLYPVLALIIILLKVPFPPSRV